MPKPTIMSLIKWFLLFLLTFAVFDAAFVGLAGLALNLSFRSLLQPYVMIFCCGLILSVLLYWTRQSFDRPKSCAIRFSLTVCSYLLLFMFVVLLSAARVGIISQSAELNDYAPYICLGSVITGSMVYFMARKKLEVMQLRPKKPTEPPPHP